MADQHGSTRLTLGVGLAGPRPVDTLLGAVRKAVAADFDVLGELGRGARGKVVYLARERTSGHLVALQLVPAPGGERSGDMFLDVLRKLDGSVPAAEAKCPNCGDALRGWLRYCSHCGADLSGVAPDSGPGTSRAQLLEAVREAAGQTYEILGEMARAEGGGVVYFARERATDKIGALRLQRKDGTPGGRERYELGRTRMLDAVVQELVGSPASETPAPPAPPPKPAPAPVVTGGPPPPPVVTPPPPAPIARPPKDDSRVWKIAAIGAGVVALALAAVLLAGREANTLDGAASGTGTDSVPDTVNVALVDSGYVQIGGKLPAAAAVTVDGQPVTGASIAMAPGLHTLEVVAKGYRSASQEIDVPPGQTVIWTPQLVATATPQPPRPRPKPKPAATPLHTAARDTMIVAAQQPPGPGQGGPTGVSSTCASLFGHLEWSRALSACTQEAGQGGIAAQRTVGIMHERGLATEPNLATAASWYRKAADGGDRIAQYRLGILLRDGRSGIKRDEKLAVHYFQRAADQGEPDAQFALGQMLERGKGVRKNREEAAGWYLRAAEQGQPEAQYALALLLAKGDGVAKSEADAVGWFQRAAAQGHQKALEELRKRGRAPS